MKLSPAAAGTVASSLDLATHPALGVSNRIVADPTDLLALPLALAAFAWGVRRKKGAHAAA